MQKSFWSWECSNRYIISLSLHIPTKPDGFCGRKAPCLPYTVSSKHHAQYQFHKLTSEHQTQPRSYVLTSKQKNPHHEDLMTTHRKCLTNWPALLSVWSWSACRWTPPRATPRCAQRWREAWAPPGVSCHVTGGPSGAARPSWRTFSPAANMHHSQSPCTQANFTRNKDQRGRGRCVRATVLTALWVSGFTR